MKIRSQTFTNTGRGYSTVDCPLVEFEIDDDEVVALIEKILLKPCIYCNGGKLKSINNMPLYCNTCSGTGKIRKF